MGHVHCDTLIISDLHLGSEISRAQQAFELLRGSTFRRLILLGDIFSDLNFRRLKKEHWKFLSCIRKLSNHKRGVEVVWVEGNHDRGLSTLMSHLVGVPVYQRYSWNYGGRRHMAIHGHQFDRFVIHNVPLIRFGEFLYSGIQKLDHKSKCFSHYLDRLNTRWLRLSNKVAEGALAVAGRSGADRVFCGHTHVARHVEKGGIDYYNSGSWVSSPCTFIAIDEDGVKIHEFQSRNDHSDTSEEREELSPRVTELALATGLPADLEHTGAYC